MKSTKEQLLSIMEQYEIGKKPLSRLLGWGETTVMRYLDGVEPNKEFAAKIEELYENPWQYAELLEKGKSALTDTAYKKTKRAVYRRMFCDKSTEAMQYVVSLAEGDISPFRVMAVLYFAQVYSLVCRGLPIFEEEVSIETKQKTPYPRLYEQLMNYGLKVQLPEEGALTAEDREFLDGVYQILNGYSPNAVRAVLKRDKLKLRRNKAFLQDAEHLNAEELRRYYETMMQKTGMQSVEDLKNYFAARLKEK
ncbi:MAG: hypothetical protein ACI4FZ_00920 [Lachnospiraceae bacterium]